MRRLLLVLGIAGIFVMAASDSIAAEGKARKRRSGTVLYELKENASDVQKQALTRALARRKLTTRRKILNERIHCAASAVVKGTSEEALAAELMATGAVEFAEPDYLLPIAVSPNDPMLSQQWFHTKIESPGAWDCATGSSTVIVAVCDTGVESTHPDLSANMRLPGYNAVDGSSNSEPIHPHGTRVAGCIGAVGNNGIGVAGVCWSIRILPIRITNSSDGMAYTSDMADGIRWAADHGAKVANLSYSGAGSSTVDSAAQYMRSKGGLLFMAAGNNGAEQSYSDYTSFVAVGSVNSGDNHSGFSNTGEFIDIVAPGEGIVTTNTGGGYTSASGTSFASPIAAGLAALIWSADSSLTPAEVEQIIFDTCVDLGAAGDDSVYGHGRINARAALLRIGSPVNAAPVASFTASPTSGVAPVQVSFNGSASHDSDGNISSYSWTFGDGSIGTGAVVQHVYSTVGAYAAKLTVTDNDGASSTMQTTITALEPEVHNVAVTSVTAPTTATIGDTITITAVAANLGNRVETFTVQLSETGSVIGTKQVSALAAGQTQSLTFSWSTTGAAAGDHILTAEASPVAGETTATDNFATDCVTLTAPDGSSGNGLKGEYFGTISLTDLKLTRTDPIVDFIWLRGTSPDACMDENTYSVRWSGQVQPKFSETYTFYTVSDDGVRLWVNGQKLIDNWTYHSAKEDKGTIALQAGQKVNIVMEYFEGTGDSRASLLWSSASQAKQAVPRECLFSEIVVTSPEPDPEPEPGSGNGLSATYYDNANFTGSTVTRIDPAVDFDWKRGTAPASGMGDDYFSVRWTGQVQPLYSESYTFYTVSDDGIRLWVNGEKVIDNWTYHSACEDKGYITLAAGQRYNIVLEFFDGTGDARASLLWSSSSQSKQVIPEACLYSGSASNEPFPDGQGLTGTYFASMDFTGPVLTRVDPTVDFSWPRNTSPDAAMSTDYYSIRWTGKVLATHSETYTFYTVSDDGVRLWVNGQKVVDNWTFHSVTENKGYITLTAGQKYDIIMEYYEGTGDSVARLLWSSSSQPKEVIPRGCLFAQ